MTVQALLQDLTTRDVTLTVDGDRLDVDAPDGVLTGELLDTLRANKAELLKLLTPQPSALSASVKTDAGTGKQVVAESLARNECPECHAHLDLQSKRDGGIYWCAYCRKFYTMNE